MKFSIPKFSLTVLFTLLISIVSFPQNINDALRLSMPGLGANARALGMGNSYLSLSDDASAAYFNPAGFALLRRLEFSGGISYNKIENETQFLGETTSYSNSTTRLDRLSFAFPFPTMRGSLVFGLSYHNSKDLTSALKFSGFNNSNTSMIQDLNVDSNIPFDLYLTDDNYETPINGSLRQSGDILSSGGINNWTFSGAIEVYRNVFIGGNLNILSGSFESNNDYFESDVNNIYQGETAAGEPLSIDFMRFHLNRILNWDISGWDAKVGFLYQMQSLARLGFTVQFPKTYSIKENFAVDASADFRDQTFFIDRANYEDEVKYDIISPFELGAGFSINFKGLIFSAEATLIDYSQIKFDNPEGLSTQYIAGLNKDIKDNLRSVFNYNLGLEYTVPTLGIRVRAGYLVQPSAYQDDPSKYDRKYITGGLGFLADETIGIDLGYAHGLWEDFGDNYGSNVSRTMQDITNDKLILTATYRF